MYLITNMDKGCKDKRKICTFLLLNEKLVGIVLTHASKSDVVVCTRNMQSEKSVKKTSFRIKYSNSKSCIYQINIPVASELRNTWHLITN